MTRKAFQVEEQQDKREKGDEYLVFEKTNLTRTEGLC